MLRFWNPIDNFRDMFKQLFVNKVLCPGTAAVTHVPACQGDFLARLFSAGGAFGCGMTFVMDHFSYIHKVNELGMDAILLIRSGCRSACGRETQTLQTLTGDRLQQLS